MKKVKEYLKMSDVFPFTVSFDSDGGIGAVVDIQGEYIAQAMENNYCSHMSNKDKNEYRNKVARYVAHSVESHDELVNQRNELLKALEAKKMIPDGWQLVPIEPTIEMISAATHDSVGFGTRAEYKAMLSAAPKFEGDAA